MRIGMDYRPAMRARTGIGRYASALAAALVAQGADLRLWGVFRKGNRPAARRAPPGTRLVATPMPSRLARLLAVSGVRTVERALGGIDLFHHTNFLLVPVRRATPQVMTVHDLCFLRDAGCHAPRAAAALTRVVERARDACAAILVPSEATARDCEELLGIARDRLHVTPLGVEERFFRATAPPRRGAPYLLAVGTLEPRKNHARLVRAYRAAFGGRDDAPRLRIAGRPGWMFAELEAEARATPGVVLEGHVPDGDLPALYAGALAVLYPSRLEGFGLPVLEGMAAGRAVLTSDREPMRSIAGDAALLVDPDDEEALADALRRLVDDAALRARLERAGPDRARRYDWARCARATLRAYEAVIA